MALFTYEALARDGSRKKGTIDASSASAAKEQLKQQGLYPTSILPVLEGQSRTSRWRSWLMRNVSIKEKILFTHQLAVLIRAGVQIVQALELLAAQMSGLMRETVVHIKDRVKEGSSLADAIGLFPSIFDVVYIQLVRAGEASGNLDLILDRLAAHLERRDEIQKKVRRALRTPLIQLGAAFFVIVFLLTTVLPRMIDTITLQGKQLPGITRIMMRISYVVSHYYLFIGAFLVALIALFYSWKKTKQGSQILDELSLRIPLVAQFVRTNAVVQFSYTLGILLESGVHLTEALDIVCKVVDNQSLTNTLVRAKENIIKQGNIAEYLQKTNLFPPLAIHLIRTGEQSAHLGPMLLTVASLYEQELKESVDLIISLIGPFMLIVVGSVILLIIASVALPMMSLMEGFAV